MNLLEGRIFALIEWPGEFDNTTPTAIVGVTVEAVHRQAAHEITQMHAAIAHESSLAALFDVGCFPTPDAPHADLVAWLEQLSDHSGLYVHVLDGSTPAQTVVQAPHPTPPEVTEHHGDSRTFTTDEIESALNAAASDIEDACDLPETGPIDALNLLINVTAWYLKHPDRRSLRDAIEGSYATSVEEVLSWPTS